MSSGACGHAEGEGAYPASACQSPCSPPSPPWDLGQVWTCHHGPWQVLETVVCCPGGKVSGTRLGAEKYFVTFMLQEKMCNA